MNTVEAIKRIYCICYPMIICVLSCVYSQDKKKLQIKVQVLVIVTYYIYIYILQTLN